jgi:hypothetical protein
VGGGSRRLGGTLPKAKRGAALADERSGAGDGLSPTRAPELPELLISIMKICEFFEMNRCEHCADPAGVRFVRVKFADKSLRIGRFIAPVIRKGCRACMCTCDQMK